MTKFRILYTGSVPPGSILLGPTVDRNQQEQIRKALAYASPNITAAAGYLPNATVPDYKELITVVERVRAIAKQIKEKPVRLYK